MVIVLRLCRHASHLLHHFVEAAFAFFFLFHFRGRINDELVFGNRRVKIPDRFKEPGFITHFDETIEQLPGDGHGHQRFAGVAVEQAFEGDVFPLRQNLYTVAGEHPADIVGCTQVPGHQPDVPVQVAKLHFEFHGEVLAFDEGIECGNVQFKNPELFKLSLQSGVVVGLDGFAFENRFLCYQGR